jgi:hypothetical protein
VSEPRSSVWHTDGTRTARSNLPRGALGGNASTASDNGAGVAAVVGTGSDGKDGAAARASPKPRGTPAPAKKLLTASTTAPSCSILMPGQSGSESEVAASSSATGNAPRPPSSPA